jgi:hypothetical protein
LFGDNDLNSFSLSLLMAAAAPTGATADEADAVLEPVRVTAERVAIAQPASTYVGFATALRYDPQVNLQSRGLPEAQADVTVRGGLFENTGFRVGAVTVFDPQTGHYSVELPIDPAMLDAPVVVTGAENALQAFNASVATIQYGFRDIDQGGNARVGAGTDGLWFASARVGHSRETSSGKRFGLRFSVAGSQGDGTRPNGDHDFKRLSAQAQWAGERQQTHLVLGYQDKFFGWPGMYTGFSSLPETDHAKTGLVLIDHRRTGADGWLEIAGAYRWLDDDYDFDRRTIESGAPGSFEHETRSFSLGLQGMQHVAGIDWHFSAQFSADRLVRSTDLTEGDFNSRSYLNASLAPQWGWDLAGDRHFSLQAGLRVDASNRDEDAVMPLVAAEWEQPAGGGVNRFGLSYAGTSQVPGYTALNSRPTGLFGGNPDLGREYTDVAELSFEHSRDHWLLRTAVFYRQDDDLVDWTYRQGAPFARQANTVDIDVTGIEALLAWRMEKLEWIAGYAWLEKDADYGSADVDASFYALNFARHRATLALIFRPAPQWEVRMDNEYRAHEDNALRSNGDNGYLASLSVLWRPGFAPRSRFVLVADNLTDDDFQEFPGTPAYGRQLSLSAGLEW